MHDIAMDMEQYDCPFIDTTDDHDVSFSAVQWNFDTAARRLETRMIVDGPDRAALDDGLTALRAHDGMHDFDLLRKREGVAQIRTVIDETDAMETVRRNDGYITGPFYIEDGSEVWHVGFDSAGVADGALSELDRNNEFDVIERDHVDLPELQDLINNAGAAMALIQGTRDLSDTERRTLERAARGGYFRTPRETDLGDLAEEFDVSKPAVSKNLRRGQQKLLEQVTEAIEKLDG
ncbi:MAG: helix-turn-helix domain-containing protein [Halobacteriales archaeon]